MFGLRVCEVVPWCGVGACLGAHFYKPLVSYEASPTRRAWQFMLSSKRVCFFLVGRESSQRVAGALGGFLPASRRHGT